MTFFCNAAVAVLAGGVLLFSQFPAAGSVMIEDGDEEGEGEGGNERDGSETACGGSDDNDDDDDDCDDGGSVSN